MPVVDLSYPQNVRMWAEASPRRKDGRRLYVANTARFKPADVEVDRGGNIIAMPVLIDKPCFGVITAFARHGKPLVGKDAYTGKLYKGRCGRCHVRSACMKVVKTRIAVVPGIAQAYRKWHAAGLRAAFGSDWRAFVDAVVAHGPFNDCNDQAAAKAVLEKDGQRRERDRQRKQQARKLARQKPTVMVPEVLQDALEEERKWRAERLVQASKHPAAGAVLRRLAREDAWMAARVWWASMVLLEKGEKVTPKKIATFLHLRMYKSWKAREIYGRVLTEYRRLSKWATTLMPGDKIEIWPPFVRPISII